MSTAGARFDDLIRIMATLRGPDGCPWDRVQTLASLRPFLLEETYEALEALDAGDHAGLREELGDLLFEIVFLSRIAEEQGDFTIADAIDTVAPKLVRRHPHVFGDADKLSQPEEVRGRWEELKAAERSRRWRDEDQDAAEWRAPRVAGAAPRVRVQQPRRDGGVRLGRPADVLDKMEEELREIREAVERSGSQSRRRDGARARRTCLKRRWATSSSRSRTSRGKLGVEPEAALRRANDKFRERFTAVEQRDRVTGGATAGEDAGGAGGGVAGR